MTRRRQRSRRGKRALRRPSRLGWVVLAAALLGSAWLLLTLGWQTLLKALLAGALALLLLRWLVNTVREYRLLRRREALLERYGDEQVVDDLLEQVLWEGETAAQVRDSLGEPQAVDVLPRQTKKKELWKYGHEGGNRYRLRVTLDDDLVVSWVLRD